MDKKIYRYFDLQYQENKEGPTVGFHYLIQFSSIEGEYGRISFKIVAQTDYPFDFHCFFIETSGASEGVLFELRQAELQYFLSFILPLFNPLKRLPDGLQETQQETPDLS